MRKIIKTKSHTFSVTLRKNRTDFNFEIMANCVEDKTKSSITNLNFILSELIQPLIQIEDYESWIITNKQIGKQLYKDAIELFNDIEWLNYLEWKLEDDKKAGEWER